MLTHIKEEQGQTSPQNNIFLREYTKIAKNGHRIPGELGHSKFHLNKENRNHQ